MFPRAEGAMRFECGHPAKNSFVHERWHAPFERFFHVRARSMHELAQMLEDGLGKVRRFRNVSVNLRIFFGHEQLCKDRACRQHLAWPRVRFKASGTKGTGVGRVRPGKPPQPQATHGLPGRTRPTSVCLADTFNPAPRLCCRLDDHPGEWQFHPMIAVEDAVGKLRSLSPDRSQRVLALIEDLAEVQLLEDKQDVESARESVTEPRDNMPLDQLAKELG